MKKTQHLAYLCAMVVTMVLLTSCADGGSSTAVVDSEAPSPTENTSETEEPQELTPVDTVVSGRGALSLMPTFVAEFMGFFEEEGLEINLLSASGGSNAAAAILSGEADVGTMAVDYSFTAANQGQSMPAVAPISTTYPLEILTSPELMEERGITRDMSIEEKFSKMAGVTFGVTSPGSSTDQLTRYALRRGGLDPDSDVTIIALGGVPEVGAAFESGQVQAFVASPPTAQRARAAGAVALLDLAAGDVPELTGIVNGVIVVNRAWAEDNRDVAIAYVRAVLRALQLLEEDPETAADAVYEDPEFREATPDRADFDAGFEAVLATLPTIDSIKFDRQVLERTNEAYIKGVQGIESDPDYDLVAMTDIFDEALESFLAEQS